MPELATLTDDEIAGLRRVLVVAAHPDDVDFGAAGSVARLTAMGAEVAYLVLTDGDAGIPDELPAPELAALRRSEQLAAAAAVRVTDVRFAGFRDGQLEPTLDLRRAIAATIREHRPDLVIGQSPERSMARIVASHPDHLAAGEATLRAVYPDARNRRSFPELAAEGLEPHKVDVVWLSGSPSPNLAVDVTDQFDAKLAALRCHASQTGGWTDLAGDMRGWLARTAAAARMAPGRLAEAFEVVQISLPT